MAKLDAIYHLLFVFFFPFWKSDKHTPLSSLFLKYRTPAGLPFPPSSPATYPLHFAQATITDHPFLFLPPQKTIPLLFLPFSLFSHGSSKLKLTVPPFLDNEIPIKGGTSLLSLFLFPFLFSLSLPFRRHRLPRFFLR